MTGHDAIRFAFKTARNLTHLSEVIDQAASAETPTLTLNQLVVGGKEAVYVSLTQDADAAYHIARRIRTGAVGQNGLRMDFGLPYGGFKQSGVGREGGIEGLSAYLETKTILLDAPPKSLG